MATTTLLRILARIAQHPATSAAVNHLIREGTAALIRHIRSRRSRSGRVPAF